jgi:hypothetical protein
MNALPSLLTLGHLLGLALAVGAATVKLVLVLRSSADPGFAPTFLSVSRPITRLIVLGLILLTLSGIGWLLLGYPLGPLLVVKLVMVAAIWVLGPVIDNVVEPRLLKLTPVDGAPSSLQFSKVQKQYVVLEVIATGLFYVIVVMWVLL